VLSLPDELNKVAVAGGGVAFVLRAVGYFVTFWSTTGQTPGNSALRIRVRTASGGRMPPRRALLRFVGLTLAALPLFAAFLLILVDDRRGGLHDRLARTVVVEAGDDGPAVSPRPHRTALDRHRVDARRRVRAPAQAVACCSSPTSASSPNSMPRARTITGHDDSVATRRETPPSSTARLGP
jgi:hypothetical protein